MDRTPAAAAARALLDTFSTYDSTLTAFSGGVDSALVVAAAVRVLGPGRTAAATAVSPSLPAHELEQAARFCRDLGVEHLTVTTAEMDVEGYRANGRDRCAFCKATLLDRLTGVAAERGFAAVATGTNASDVADGFRPGIAAAARRGARTPLADAGLTKDDVRAVARLWGLPVWDKPAAACLASRIAYGLRITPARLARVERAEAEVRAVLAGLPGRSGAGNVRVRDLGGAVRLELDGELLAAGDADPRLVAAVRGAGFDAPVTVAAFRSGSMNDAGSGPVPAGRSAAAGAGTRHADLRPRVTEIHES